MSAESLPGSHGGKGIPESSHPDIAGSLLLQEGANLLKLGATRAGIVEEIAELTRARFHFLDIFLELRVALEHQHLMLGPAFLRQRMDRVD
jgi:hypothetical protein